MNNKIIYKILCLSLILTGIFFCPNQNKAEPVTLGIIGTALGGTALGLTSLHWLKDLSSNNCSNGCCGGGCMQAMPVAAPVAMAPAPMMSQAACQPVRYVAPCPYPAACPSYNGWYSPYGNVGMPCPTCHIMP